MPRNQPSAQLDPAHSRPTPQPAHPHHLPMSTASSRTSASCVSFPAHGLPLYSPSNTCFRRLSAKLPNAPMFHLSQPVFPGGCARRPTLPPPSSPPTCPRHLVVLLPEMLVVRGLISAVKNEQPFIGREFAKGLARKSCPLPSPPSPSPPPPPSSPPPPSPPPSLPREGVSKMAACANV